MTDIFVGTGAKRYALRFQEPGTELWEYPGDLRFDTVEAAKAALAEQELQGRHCELVELLPHVKYPPGLFIPRPLLLNLLEDLNLKPYMLQDRKGANHHDLQFDTLEEAEAACGSQYRVVTAALGVLYRPVEGL